MMITIRAQTAKQLHHIEVYSCINTYLPVYCVGENIFLNSNLVFKCLT